MPHLPSILAILLVTIPALAQSEATLRKAFEGKRVHVKIEMPATKWGIDVAQGNEPPIDFRAYQRRIEDLRSDRLRDNLLAEAALHKPVR